MGHEGTPATRGPEGPLAKESGDIRGKTVSKGRGQGPMPLHSKNDSLNLRPRLRTRDYSATVPSHRRHFVNADSTSLTQQEKNETDQGLAYFSSQGTL